MRKSKKLLSIILSAAVLLSTMAGMNLTARADVLTGKCGQYVTYYLDISQGILMLDGSSTSCSTYDYNYDGYWSSDSHGTSPFSGNLNIKAVYIENTITYLGSGIFEECENITSVTTNSLIKIGGGAFQRCKGLMSITIPDGVTNIGPAAFRYCTGLNSVTIPKSVTTISYYAFDGCTSLRNVYYPGTREQFSSIYSETYNKPLKNATLHCHTHTPIGTGVVTAPTCTTGGYTTYTCSECGEVYTGNKTSALGHRENSGEITKQPTCTENGTRTYRCANCNMLMSSVTIWALGHSLDPNDKGTVTQEATCVTEGIRSYRCTRCDGVAKTERIEPTGHKEVLLEAIMPTCSAEGRTEGTVCSVCGEILRAPTTLAKKSHIYTTTVTKADVAKKKNGKIVSVCSVCNEKVTTTLYYPKAVTLSYNKTTYNGKAKKPKVTVKDSNGNAISSSNYTVTYTNNKKIGTAKVTVKFKGNYKGTLTKSFTINPIGSVADSWEVSPTTIHVSWEKWTKNITGYVVQYSTTKNFKKGKTKTKKIKGVDNIEIFVKNYNRGSTYYFRVRTYKVVGKKTYYSDWQSDPNGYHEPPLKIVT